MPGSIAERPAAAAKMSFEPDPSTQAVLAHAGLTSAVGAAPASKLNVRAVATPDPVAPGQRVNYGLTVSNTATATHTVAVTATVSLKYLGGTHRGVLGLPPVLTGRLVVAL
jgi:hypothetical protein